ncbi:MAG: methyltransferase domain-containing protein [Cyanobacteriota bacterium]|nr:methyltransferase domain-containing protein [Cyanobacteriota bacterium]
MTASPIDHSAAVQARYGAAAQEQEACLCCAVSYDPSLLEVIPVEVVERDYGCGDPTRWVRPGDTVLDLGSGSGKNAFLCAQLVGPGGRVIGLDRNPRMLELARWAAPIVADKIGYANVSFREAAIENLTTDLAGLPLLDDASVDLVLSNCVLNLVRPDGRGALLREIRRVLRPGGRVAISDIVSDRPVPLDMQQDPELWSGCISGAWQEERFLEDFRALGFEGVHYADRQETPWRVVEGIAFRAVTLVGHRPGAAAPRCC